MGEAVNRVSVVGGGGAVSLENYFRPCYVATV